MKRLAAIWTSLALFLILANFDAAGSVSTENWPGQYPDVVWEDGVYKLYTVAGLSALSNAVCAGNTFEGAEIWLMNDLARIGRLRAIGTPEAMFQGTFDGRGYALEGLQIKGDNGFQGLFGFVGASGRVRNLTLSGAFVMGGRYTGGVAAYSAGVVENCLLVGGSHVTGMAKSRFSVATGGIVGCSTGDVLRCAAMDATIAGHYNVGGIAGSLHAGELALCMNAARVVSRARDEAALGGVVGAMHTGCAVRACLHLGEVVGNAARCVGGIVGSAYSGLVKQSFSLGEVVAEAYAGAIVGYLAPRAQAIACTYAAGDVPRAGAGAGRQDSMVAILPMSTRARSYAEWMLAASAFWTVAPPASEGGEAAAVQPFR